jgi:membrane protease YdiL (CAAX protease family)
MAETTGTLRPYESTMTTPALPAPAPAAMDRATALRRALLFLAVCSPLYLTPGVFSVGHPAVMAAIVLAVTALFLRWDGRPLSVLGLEPSIRRLGELAAGFAGGALVILVVALGARMLLPFPWVRNPSFTYTAAGFSLLWLLFGNAVEELIFRGYSFERLIGAVGHWKAQLVTALLFALFHVMQGWSWQVALTGTTIGSLFFGLVFIRWRSVPAAVGTHVAANWMRDLILTDPPTAKTLFAPLSPRPWTSGEQMTAMLLLDGILLLTSLALWRSSRVAPESVIAAE